jgi:inosine-uridine nucleoside N-ribohydrolase
VQEIAQEIVQLIARAIAEEQEIVRAHGIGPAAVIASALRIVPRAAATVRRLPIALPAALPTGPAVAAAIVAAP